MKIRDLRGQTMGGNTKRDVVNHIVRHHSATTSGNVNTFERYWRSKGWETGGYHEIILRDGTVERCYDWNVIANGVKGHNSDSYHICLVGRGQFTDEQERIFEERVNTLMDQFELEVSVIVGHRELAGGGTQCPGINMDEVRSSLRNGQTSRLLRLGDQGDAVKQLQVTLINRGYDLSQYGTDGIFGSETEDAVISLQQDGNITVDGIVGPETRDVLNRNRILPNGIYQRGSQGGEVKRIQSALDELGFSLGPIDGIYGPKTEKAIERFQSKFVPNEVDRIYGPNTREAMLSALT
ncbi:N-acetylmuramoyl-L-alanine amidase [Alkalibacillus sp. S2W]|uniref:peptidoglycan recognition protein family protein n=1 Tax=Alkalibacillus TaxID=331654 RepID=UPI00141F07D1|nr:N-acetylmuramoyl-L-alanine amidase [Alkalibacillus almallahensis]NIK13171.1 peptidoglycan hydrolase-like protein with peptidoglycan-binding domain [Alkalibacillus almallahensis]